MSRTERAEFKRWDEAEVQVPSTVGAVHDMVVALTYRIEKLAEDPSSDFKREGEIVDRLKAKIPRLLLDRGPRLYEIGEGNIDESALLNVRLSDLYFIAYAVNEFPLNKTHFLSSALGFRSPELRKRELIKSSQSLSLGYHTNRKIEGKLI